MSSMGLLVTCKPLLTLGGLPVAESSSAGIGKQGGPVSALGRPHSGIASSPCFCRNRQLEVSAIGIMEVNDTMSSVAQYIQVCTKVLWWSLYQAPLAFAARSKHFASESLACILCVFVAPFMTTSENVCAFGSELKVRQCSLKRPSTDLHDNREDHHYSSNSKTW